MTPIERMSEKARALTLLNLPATASTADIRTAFKRLVQEKHPDHCDGSSEEFSEINAAYQFLWNHTDELGIRNTQRPSRRVQPRPSLKPTETSFSDPVLRECEAALPGDSLHRQHVATALHRVGRKLTYFVPAAPSKGINQVAVATGELVDTRHAHPQIVELEAGDVALGGVYDVPGALCADLFPGARSVKIQFGALPA
ncbi:MAG: J domain-containing protein [Silicimonas sp.]|nr:J domain-containing protein [Silicimonas sp.]